MKQGGKPLAQFCRDYGIHRATYFRRRKKGLVPPLRTFGPGSKGVILASDEEAWLESIRSGELNAPSDKGQRRG